MGIEIYILAAVLPALVLLFFVYRKDKIEKEPMDLIVKLLLMGVLSALLASAVESLGMGILDSLVDAKNPYYTVLLAFLVVAAVEEGCKFILMKRRSWNDPNFNFRFDGIVYAVTVSLGFAALENIIYVFGYGLSVAPVRAIFAVPGHMSFAVFMGYFYGRARLKANFGDRAGSSRSLWAGYLSAVFFHGFYDTCAMTESDIASVLFLIFVAVMFIWVFILIRRESNTDRPIV